jgi:Rps23 Pro-64 3,4-dihydroxylase Tpa1-like proline 4-hydroxylase
MQDIMFYDDVLKEQFAKHLLRDSMDNLSSGRGFTHSNFHWSPGIVKASQVVLVRDYEQEMAALILSQLQDRGILDDEEYHVNDYHVMNYAWTKLSYIPWHNDPDYKNAITVYLNEHWDRDWGGIYLYVDRETKGIKGYVPQFNSGLKNNSKLDHSTTLISVDAEYPRLTIQVFPKTQS